MSRAAVLAGALIAFTAISSAAAQSWSVGVGVGYGEPAYYDPPPVYLYAHPPVLYEQPPVVYAPPPVVYAPAPVRSAVSPDAVFDALERAGYGDFGPMAFRDGVYKLNAVNHRGDVVALEVSALSGAVEREFLLQPGRPVVNVAPAAPITSPPASASPAPRTSGGDPLVVY